MSPVFGQLNGPLPPLHSPRESPGPPDNPNPWIWPLTILVVLGGILILWCLWRRYRSASARGPGQSPVTEAWNALGQLSGCAEDPAILSRISIILQRFLERSAKLKPAARTTEELMAALKTTTALSPEQLQSLHHLLHECDRRRYDTNHQATSLPPLLPQAIAWVEATMASPPDSAATPPATIGPPAP